ncbi:hypothetical protein [Methylobacterium trifolii]|uniref:Uncharacterized protein n=1 Tax=Methylobacterium trifolii TaxID=1003092 RepID=A0ABQ4U6V1_9HYPH|nr:hypothetical protein [Methylobacterium trifolii]GJE61565.1 hypothetical protein MPOCJGCO_3687 [Methylobacterium trifolii]
MARTPPNGRSPSMSMTDFNARVRRVLEGSEPVTAGTQKSGPNWTRRRSRLPATPEAAQSEAAPAETPEAAAEEV